MAVLPISLTVTPTWTDITSSVGLLGLHEKESVEIYHNGQGLIEVIIDTLGETVIDNSYNKQGRIINGSQFLAFPFTQDTTFWVRRIKSSIIENSQIQIRKPIKNVNISGVGTFKGALNIHDVDVHDRVINKFVRQNTATTTTITSQTLSDGSQYTIDVADATGFSIGDHLYINTTSVETTLPVLLATTSATGAATFTIDRRLDISHLIGDEIGVAIIDMSLQVGTIISPQIYYIAPQIGEVWHITRLLFSMTHGVAGDLGKFGGIARLTNGVVLRVKVNDQYGTFTNWKDNSEIKEDMYDVSFDSRSGGQGSAGTSGRGTFTAAGAVVRLNGNSGDRLEVFIQDDLTSLDTFSMKFQGHFENE